MKPVVASGVFFERLRLADEIVEWAIWLRLRSVLDADHCLASLQPFAGPDQEHAAALCGDLVPQGRQHLVDPAGVLQRERGLKRVELRRPVIAGNALCDLGSVDKARTLDLTGSLLARGVATLPRGMMYLSAAHTDSDIDATLSALTEAIETIR